MALMKSKPLEILEKNVTHLRALMETANDAIITVDQQGTISDTETKMKQLEKQKEELIQKLNEQEKLLEVEKEKKQKFTQQIIEK